MARASIYPPSVKPGVPRLGNLPHGWEETTFGEALEVVERPAELKDEEVYTLVNARRNRDGIVKRDELPGRSIKTKTQFYVREGDFLISRRQIIHGGCGIVPPELDGAVVSNEYNSLRARNGFLLDYLRYYSHTTHFQQTTFHCSVGVDVEKMIFRLDEWMRMPVHLPPPPEQRRIAEVLSAWDRAIEQTGALLAAKEKRKRALMQQLLTGKLRFPEFEGEEWREIHFKEIAKVTMGSSPPSAAYNESGAGLPLLQGNADIKNGVSIIRRWTSEVTKTCPTCLY